jgi:hypothetical protein
MFINFLLVLILLEFNIYFFLVNSVIKDSIIDYLSNQNILYNSVIKVIIYFFILILFSYIYSELIVWCILLLYFFYFIDIIE